MPVRLRLTAAIREIVSFINLLTPNAKKNESDYMLHLAVIIILERISVCAFESHANYLQQRVLADGLAQKSHRTRSQHPVFLFFGSPCAKEDHWNTVVDFV